jgi:hypothetical protein
LIYEREKRWINLKQNGKFYYFLMLQLYIYNDVSTPHFHNVESSFHIYWTTTQYKIHSNVYILVFKNKLKNGHKKFGKSW